MPVVAMPRIRQRCPKRKAQKSGTSVTTDIANIDPNSELLDASRNRLSATAADFLSRLVR
jgi:hypothetical protein